MNVIRYKEAPISIRSKMDTIEITAATLASWQTPGFQRPLKINEKVREIAEHIRQDGGVIPGIITLGIFEGVTYIIDGQHRIESAKLSEVSKCYADVRICKFDSMAEMGEEFVRLNSSIVKMNADDILRGLEGTEPAIRAVRMGCPFVGFGYVRRNSSSPLLSMALALRSWAGSDAESPTSPSRSAVVIAKDMTLESAQHLVAFLQVVRSAWGADVEYARLWSGLNLTMMMWIWRRLVMDKQRSGNTRYVVLTPEQFRKCAMSVSADTGYLDWLLGRHVGERDRAPAYQRLKAIFVARIIADNPRMPVKPKMPQPAWAS